MFHSFARNLQPCIDTATYRNFVIPNEVRNLSLSWPNAPERFLTSFRCNKMSDTAACRFLLQRVPKFARPENKNARELLASRAASKS